MNYLQGLIQKYASIAKWYDVLNFLWEVKYRKWRVTLLGNVTGKVLEVGVGTGNNLPFYAANVKLLAIDLSTAMLQCAAAKSATICCHYELRQENACTMTSIASNQFDWLIATFLCCVLPQSLQQAAIAQFIRVLKIGGRFKILTLVYSKNPKIYYKQRLMAPLLNRCYGVQFTSHTLDYLSQANDLVITATTFLQDDTYLLIEGYKRPTTNNSI